MISPAPNTCRLNIQPLGQFRPHRGFLLARSTLPSSVARLLHIADFANTGLTFHRCAPTGRAKGGGSTSDISAPMSRPSRRASSTTPKAAILRMLSGSGGGEEATDRPRRQGDQVEGKIFRGRGRHVGLAARRLSERCEVLD